MNRQILPLLLVVLMQCTLLEAQTLRVRLQGAHLYAEAPQLHFLTDRVLERLHNGAAVPFHFQLAIVPVSGGKPLAEASDLFVVSFDLWEERFSVVQSAPPRRRVSHLDSPAAEAWCLENLPLKIPAFDAGDPFIMKLEIRAEESREESSKDESSGLSLAGLVDIFSRKPREQPLRWSAVSGPVHLRDLKPREPAVERPKDRRQKTGAGKPRIPSLGRLRHGIGREQSAQ